MSDTLSADQELAMSGAITSANGYHRLTYQSDGNLVLYKDFPGQPPRPLSASDTDGTPVGRCVLQSDGNLVVYDASATPVWASGTDGHPGSRAVVQDDGNLVVYDADGASPLWASGTVVGLPPAGTPASGSGLRPGEALEIGTSLSSPSGRFTLVYQPDGNLVLYRDAAGPQPTYQWDTETAERPAGRVLMQHDGNLVVYDPDGSPLWASGTDGHPGASLAIQDDGNLWSTTVAGRRRCGRPTPLASPVGPPSRASTAGWR